MRPFHKRKYRRVLALALLTTITLVFLDPARLRHDPTRPRVVAFVIDSSASMMDNERSLFQVFDDLTHGEVVTNILRRWGKPDQLHLCPVDSNYGTVDSNYGTVDTQRYLQALQQIETYFRDHPNDRVVINISLGSYAPQPQEMQLIRDLIDLGAIVVAAAGNQGSANSVYPAALPGVICVGASDKGVCEAYSNRGNIDLFAEGSYQTVQKRALPGDTGLATQARTIALNGTSFAAPRVSGLIVKMLRLQPAMKTDQILEVLQATADHVVGFEHGAVSRLNALAAISPRYAAFRQAGRALLASLEVACFLILVFIALLILIPLPGFLFRVWFPTRWAARKINHIDKITARERPRPRDIRYLIECLYPGYPPLFLRARQALLDIGAPSVRHLVRAYPYKTQDEFGDFKTCVYDLIQEIGGPEAEEFLRAEQAREVGDSETLGDLAET